MTKDTAFVEVPARQVPDDRMLQATRDYTCLSLGLPAIQIRYFRPAATEGERAMVKFSNIARRLELYDQVDGFEHSACLYGLTIMGDESSVWVRHDAADPPSERVRILLHELRHQQQALMMRTREGAQADTLLRHLRENQAAVKQWMEADAEAYADAALARLERGEPF